MNVLLRPATIADHAGIVEVFLDCWRVSYRGLLPDAVIDAMTPERASALWQRVLTSGAGTTAVATDNDRVVGVTRWSDADVYSLYVSPAAHGGGVGTKLLAHAAGSIADVGHARAHLWVFADNAPSVAFYASRGWTATGEDRVQDEFGCRELRLQKELVP